MVVVDSTGVASGNLIEETATLEKDSTMPFKRFKAEGVSAVIGEYVILDSDIDKNLECFNCTFVTQDLDIHKKHKIYTAFKPKIKQ